MYKCFVQVFLGGCVGFFLFRFVSVGNTFALISLSSSFTNSGVPRLLCSDKVFEKYSVFGLNRRKKHRIILPIPIYESRNSSNQRFFYFFSFKQCFQAEGFSLSVLAILSTLTCNLKKICYFEEHCAKIWGRNIHFKQYGKGIVRMIQRHMCLKLLNNHVVFQVCLCLVLGTEFLLFLGLQ